MLNLVSEAQLPIRVAGANIIARAVSFEDDKTATPLLAVVIGALNSECVLVRVHSGCLTGDVLGSLRCDCGEQLAYSLEFMKDRGAGILVYAPADEGRGIGLVNKMRAYHLQDNGLDTVDANLAIGAPVDSRRFDEPAIALKLLGVTDIELMTNNPMKVDALVRHGLTVRRHQMPSFSNMFNLRYLSAKHVRMGHLAGNLPSDGVHS